MNPKLIFDAHTHLNDQTYQKQGYEIAEILKEANDQGVGYFLNVSFSVKSSQQAIKQAHEFKNVYAAIGIHPMNVHRYPKSDLQIIAELARDEKVVAIGEVGLDYYWQKENHQQQKNWFIEQIKIAEKYHLPLMMHIRDEKNNYTAYDDVLEIISQYRLPKMVVHCFSANAEYAQKFLDLGCYINVGGAVTFKNARDLQAAVKVIPWEKLLVETDAPYLTPHPFRGKLNFPKMITYTVEKIAALKEVDYEKVVEATTRNAFKIFGLEKRK